MRIKLTPSNWFLPGNAYLFCDYSEFEKLKTLLIEHGLEVVHVPERELEAGVDFQESPIGFKIRTDKDLDKDQFQLRDQYGDAVLFDSKVIKP